MEQACLKNEKMEEIATNVNLVQGRYGKRRFDRLLGIS